MGKNNIANLEQKVMEGLRLAVKKLIDQSIRDNQPLIVSIDNKIQKIYPKKAS
jgi:hypothetical protein